jgi:hypothetical protein
LFPFFLLLVALTNLGLFVGSAPERCSFHLVPHFSGIFNKWYVFVHDKFNFLKIIWLSSWNNEFNFRFFFFFLANLMKQFLILAKNLGNVPKVKLWTVSSIFFWLTSW